MRVNYSEDVTTERLSEYKSRENRPLWLRYGTPPQHGSATLPRSVYIQLGPVKLLSSYHTNRPWWPVFARERVLLFTWLHIRHTLSSNLFHHSFSAPM